MNKCTHCHKRQITRYVGLKLCNKCYYVARKSIEKISLDGVTCVACKKRPAEYKAKQLCAACYTAEWRKRIGPQTVRERMRQWRDAQSAEWRANCAKIERERRAQMGDVYRAKERERNKKRREQRIVYNHAYYAAHAEQLRKYQSQFRKDHPAWVSEVKRRRRTHAVGLPTTLTEQEWQTILTKWRHRCSYCGRSDVALVKDHAIPLTRGGGYTADNIRPACHSCNSRKHTLTADEFLRKLGKSSP